MISKNNQKGSILIGIIVAMVLFAALGTAILSLTSTATMNQVMANSAARAYYLAESGFRYAYYHRENGNNLESTLESLHDKTLTLNNNDGSSYLNVYPYYLKVTANPQGEVDLQTKFPGGIPEHYTDDEDPATVQIGSNLYNYSGGRTRSGDIITLKTFEASLPYIPPGTDVLYVAETKSTQIVEMDGTIDLRDNTALGFPLRNGLIEINDHIYSYKKFDHTDYSLQGIKDPKNNVMESLSFDAHEKIVLQKFAKVESIGTFGTGDHQSVRKIVYYVPFPVKDRGERVEFHEKFDEELSALPWTSVLGSHEVDDHALKVTGTGDVGSSDSGSLIIFEWETETEAEPEPIMNLGSSHEYAGKYLSYDAQVKIGFNAQVSYMAGISFRLVASNGASDSFGISFLKNNDNPMDRIPLGLLPSDVKGYITDLLIVLWQNTVAGGRKWLAYKKLSGDPNFATDATILVRIMEAASIKFTNGGPAPVKAGDIVSQTTSYIEDKIEGKVVGSPILKSGIWANGNAEGIILLNNVRGTFTAGETIKVGSTIIATVDSGPEPYSEKDNYIRAYYGTSNGSTSNLGIPSDDNRLGYPRNDDIQWPPDNIEDWSADNDYFTLVRWDLNSSVTPLESVDEPGAIIRSDSLITDSFSSTKPEIGLHTFGINSTSIYFDDFAMQAIIEADAIILPVVQE